MRRFLILIVMMLAALAAQAADVRLQWDPNPDPAADPWTFVRIYERTGASGSYVFTKVAEVVGTATEAVVANVAPGVHAYVARSVNSAWESPDSNVVVLPPVPTGPSNLRYTITIQITGGD